jgi:hypothetical protein
MANTPFDMTLTQSLPSILRHAASLVGAVLLVPTMIYGCSSGSPSPTTSGTATSTPASTSAGTSSSGTASSGTSSPGTSVEVRTDPTSGFVSCAGASTCPALSHPQQNVDTESYCCVSDVSAVCVHNYNLGACESGVPIYCDDASDCDPGLHCCNSQGRTLFACQSSCGDRMQLCRQDAECPNGTRCTGSFDASFGAAASSSPASPALANLRYTFCQ